MSGNGNDHPGGIDIRRVKTRLDMINNESNKSIQEITRSGRLRIFVQDAFNNADGAIVMLAQIAVLKLYADKACLAHGEPMTAQHWTELFQMFEQGAHEMKGVPS